MAGSDSRKASGTPRPAKITEQEIPTANEPAVEPLRLGGTGGFDPSNSFFPQALLVPGDLSPLALKPRPRPAWHVRYAKALVAVVLAFGAGLAYVFFLSGPAAVPGSKDTAAKAAKDTASATGTITTPVASAVVAPAASIPPPAVVSAPKSAAQPPASPPPVARVPAPGPQPAVVPARPLAASAPPVVYTSRPPATAVSTVTHTKAALEAAESGKAIAPAPAAAVVPPVAPSGNTRSGPCSEALAALGLCSSASK